MSQKDISIVIVSWNARRYLVDCLASIEATGKGLDYEVVVVDNASGDGSPEAVRAQFPWVKLIETGSNLGFAKANNVGVRDTTGRYYAFVNSDVIVHENCLQQLVAFMDANPAVGLAGPKLFNGDGTNQPSCRRHPQLSNHFARAFFINRSLADPIYKGNADGDVELIAGAFWIARRSAVEKVGLLDERFFFYGEDADWCLRFRQGGWRVSFCATATAIHFGGASSSVDSYRFNIELERSALQLWEKHHGRVKIAAYLVICLLYHWFRIPLCAVIALLGGPRKAEWVEKTRQHWDAIKWLNGATFKRMMPMPAALPAVKNV